MSVVKCEESTDQAFVQLVSKIMKELNRDLVGNSSDDVANMQGCCNGFSTLLSTDAPMQIRACVTCERPALRRMEII